MLLSSLTEPSKHLVVFCSDIEVSLSHRVLIPKCDAHVIFEKLVFWFGLTANLIGLSTKLRLNNALIDLLLAIRLVLSLLLPLLDLEHVRSLLILRKNDVLLFVQVIQFLGKLLLKRM